MVLNFESGDLFLPYLANSSIINLFGEIILIFLTIQINLDLSLLNSCAKFADEMELH